MKNTIVLVILFLSVVITYGQEEEHQDVFKTDSTWIKEIIKLSSFF